MGSYSKKLYRSLISTKRRCSVSLIVREMSITDCIRLCIASVQLNLPSGFWLGSANGRYRQKNQGQGERIWSNYSSGYLPVVFCIKRECILLTMVQLLLDNCLQEQLCPGKDLFHLQLQASLPKSTSSLLVFS